MKIPAVKEAALFTLTVLIVSGCASIRGPLLGGEGAFSKFDTDEDGVLNRREAESMPALAQNFDRLDTDNDGNVDQREYEAGTTYIEGVDFELIDVDGDGVVNESEAKAISPSLHESFDRVDTDGDGNVSQREYQAARTNLLAGFEFADLDTDNDGVISKDEAEELPVLYDVFDQIDTDGDDNIAQREYRALQSR